MKDRLWLKGEIATGYQLNESWEEYQLNESWEDQSNQTTLACRQR